MNTTTNKITDTTTSTTINDTYSIDNIHNYIEIQNKYLLNITEANKYFGIGENKLRQLAKEYGDRFVLQIGNKTMFKRKAFEKFIDDTTCI